MILPLFSPATAGRWLACSPRLRIQSRVHKPRSRRSSLTRAAPIGSGSRDRLALAKAWRQSGRTVAIVAVDPSSPFTGGAILGDRIRMRDLAGDPGVFIRSMASRGSLGGLARTTGDVVKLFDAAGFEIILIETVGAGQTEVEIARTAHTTVVVEAPGLGDDVQAIKAGLLEVADVLVLNKADQPGVENAMRVLRTSLELAHPTRRRWAQSELQSDFVSLPASEAQAVEPWVPPILQTVATQEKGIAEVVMAIEQHLVYLNRSGELERRERETLAYELESRLRDTLLAGLVTQLGNGQLDKAVDRIVARQIDPASAAQQLIGQMRL
jgi:LAO/AO transport system kinase